MSLPDMIVFLDKGIIFYGKTEDEKLICSRYPEQHEESDYDWCFASIANTDTGSFEGNHLGYLYYTLLNHLVNSYLEPPSLSKYIEKTLRFPRHSLKTARGTSSQSS
jgi:hypothetical protein